MPTMVRQVPANSKRLEASISLSPGLKESANLASSSLTPSNLPKPFLANLAIASRRFPGVGIKVRSRSEPRSMQGVSVSYGLVRRRVWTIWRQLWGNLAPLIISAPMFGYGVSRVWKDKDLFSQGLWWMIGSVVVGWLAVNLLGLSGNRAMRRSVERLLIENGEPLDQRRVFVGISTPSYRSMLDPHEDVGFLILKPEALHFIGDYRKLVLARHAIRKVSRVPNIHTMLGLGGWLVIDADVGDKPARMFVEPRERGTLLGNRRLLNPLLKELRSWMSREAHK